MFGILRICNKFLLVNKIEGRINVQRTDFRSSENNKRHIPKR